MNDERRRKKPMTLDESAVFSLRSTVSQSTVDKLIDLNDHNKSALSTSEDNRNKKKHDIGQSMTIERPLNDQSAVHSLQSTVLSQPLLLNDNQ